MAKKSKINASEFMASPQVRIKRTEAYAEKVRLMFAQTVNNILALNKSMPSLDEGVMFSFDGESMKMQKKVEEALRQLHSAATLAIRRGIAVEWDIANDEIDKLMNSVYGKKVLSSPEFNGWMNRNDSARDAFLNRSEKGMNLSDRVWKSVRQLRDEMEVAMTVAIGEGDSASSMSRKVREYLNDPDLMFRRFRYKAGEKDIIDPETGEVIGKEPVYKLKWKKRVKDEKTGKYKFIDYDRKSYETGQGVYKSSAKNAMRLTRTETNMAYRRADHSRWQGMDFVLGQHIEPSKNHKIEDICDKLQGDYPKDFQFDGFHPQCYCVCTPILMSEDEMAKVNEAFLKGETYTPKGKQITDYPQGFKDWVREKADKIVDAHDYGKDPYFVRNNYQAVDQILNPDKYEKKLTPLEIAAQRHEDRTPEKIDEITKKARFRAKSMDAAERYLDEFKDIEGFDTSALQDAYDHARWDDVRSEALKLAQAKRGIIESGIDIRNELSGIKDIDMTAIQDAIKNDKLNIIKAQIDALTKMKNEILALSNIENPLEVAKQFSMQDAITVNGKIQEFFNRYSWDFDSDTNLDKLKKGLEHEIQWMGTKGTKYATWKVSQDAYKKRLELVEHRIEMKFVKNSLAHEIDVLKNSNGKVGQRLLAEFDALFANNDTTIDELSAKGKDMIAKVKQLEAHRRSSAKIAAQKKGQSIGGFVPKSDAETKQDYLDYMKSIGAKVSPSNVVVDKGFIHLQGTQHRELYDNNSIETPTERRQLWNHMQSGGGHGGRGGYVQTGNSFYINRIFRAHDIRGKMDGNVESMLKAHGATDDDIKTIKLLDKKIAGFSLPFPILITRYVELSALKSVFGISFPSSAMSSKRNMLSQLSKLSSGKDLSQDPAFLSASTNEIQNVFYDSYAVKLQIEVPPNTPLYFTNNYSESEVVLGRATKLQYLSSSMGKTKGDWRTYDHLVIRCRLVP